MSKLYKAVDKRDIGSGNKCWLVNDRGVAVSYWRQSDEDEVRTNKLSENNLIYCCISRFESYAINPVLIAEW